MKTKIFLQYQLIRDDIDKLLQNVPYKLLQNARDYVYQDRVTHCLTFTNKLVARIIGYQATYTSHCAQIPEGLQVGCSCDRAQPCTHTISMLWHFHNAPNAFFPMHIPIEVQHDAWWDWITEQDFSWDTLPSRRPLWTNPFEPAYMASWREWIAPPFNYQSPQDNPLYAILSNLHVSWTTDPHWRQSFNSWIEAIPHQPEKIRAWIDLQALNPHLPLDVLWNTIEWDPRAQVQHIMALLFASPELSEQPLQLRRQKLIQLLQMALGDEPQVVLWLWSSLTNVDPDHLFAADFLRATGQTTAAVNLLQNHMPKDIERRPPVRERLIAWTDGEESLAHQIADALENHSLPLAEKLASRLSTTDYQTLLSAIKQAENDALNADSP